MIWCVAMKPTIGRIVIYKLTQQDRDALKALGSSNPNNGASEAPAIVVRVWGESCVNLKVMCDGEHTLWKTSSILGELDGNWQWPPRV